MREADNIREVEQAGADMIGFIFYSKSPRHVEEAPEYLPQRAKRAGVFVNEGIESILNIVTRFGLNYVQLHGEEPPEYCRLLRQAGGVSVIKAFSISQEKDLQAIHTYEGLCDYYLFDTKCDEHGGSGKSFDWSILNEYKGQTPFLLSGGISVENVEALKEFKHPRLSGIDINSRFEVSPGVKDVQKIKSFLNKLVH
ncbi:N-(5'-phosphoribosyl)anthranilate isomerase [termite gut metagenome]|uniref:phosphoribosylanthranilate isomerase n=1 Tax=termite gut metagenome TaxID=433724 RepID=A0A5J4SAV4_9ZZZZ